MARAKGHNHQCRYSNERSHIYILLSSLNVVQISATVINTFTHITLVPLLYFKYITKVFLTKKVDYSLYYC